MLRITRLSLSMVALCFCAFPSHSATWRTSLDRELEAKAQAEKNRSATTSEKIEVALLAFAGLVAFFKAIPLVTQFINSRSDPWAGIGAQTARMSGDALAENRSFAEFANQWQHSTAVTDGVSLALASMMTEVAGAEEPEDPALKEAKKVREFFEKTPKQLVLLKDLFAQAIRPSNETVRQHILADIYRELRLLKTNSDCPPLKPICQLAAALEGLLKQLTDKESNVSPSNLRTASTATALFERLCQPDLPPDLISRAPVRFLAVDDDPLSRVAISSALKKISEAPDLAPDGPAALLLATVKKYDVIFLDVEMPGMDGFELCGRIHALKKNRATPVVFVTSHSDYGSRDKSAHVGGQDLIGKPFLSFEIAVKALALLLQGRLDENPATPKKEPVPGTVQATTTRVMPEMVEVTPRALALLTEGKKA